MSEDETQLIGNPDLLKKILNKLEAIDIRLQSVESRIERRSFDTKPIWEKALAEIMAVKQDIAGIDRKMDILGKDMLNLRADQLDFERRIIRLEDEANRGIQTVN